MGREWVFALGLGGGGSLRSFVSASAPYSTSLMARLSTRPALSDSRRAQDDTCGGRWVGGTWGFC